MIKEFRKISLYDLEVKDKYWITNDGRFFIEVPYRKGYSITDRKTYNPKSAGEKIYITRYINQTLKNIRDKGLSFGQVAQYPVYVLSNGIVLFERYPHKVNGYYVTHLYTVDGVRYQYSIHRLVARCFIGEVEGYQVHHIDENKSNNDYTNLMILTSEQHQDIHREERKEWSKAIKSISLSDGNITYLNKSIDELVSLGFNKNSIYGLVYGYRESNRGFRIINIELL